MVGQASLRTPDRALRQDQEELNNHPVKLFQKILLQRFPLPFSRLQQSSRCTRAYHDGTQTLDDDQLYPSYVLPKGRTHDANQI